MDSMFQFSNILYSPLDSIAQKLNILALRFGIRINIHDEHIVLVNGLIRSREKNAAQ